MTAMSSPETHFATCVLCEASCGLAVKVENGKAVEVVTLACDPYALDEFWS